jgi:hypothetical protein
MPGHFAATMPLMPSWSVAVAVIVLLAAGALHVSHARAARRFARWWHAAHVAMAFGMIVMFLMPPQGAAGLYPALAVLFGAHAMAQALVTRRVSGVDRRVWAASMLDQVLMAYMLLPLADRPAALTYPAVAYLVAAAVAWLVVPERFTCMTPQRGVPVRDRPAPSDPAPIRPRSGGVAVVGRAVPQRTARPATSGAAQRLSVRLASNVTTGVRLTLMAMSLTMAWMLLAMQQR